MNFPLHNPATVPGGEVTLLPDIAYLTPNRAEKLDLYLPTRTLQGSVSPAVLWIHGGGWEAGTKSEARARRICEALASAGYVCASVDYRLGANAWPDNLYDCKNAIRFLRVQASRFHIDPSRIGVAGGSAGGHLALMVGLTADEQAYEPTTPYPGISSAVAAIIDFYGITDLNSWTHGASSIAKVFGRNGKPTPALLRDASPVTHVKSGAPPVLILHGMIDPVVDLNQAEDLDRLLTAKGVSHQIFLLSGVGHTFDLTHWEADGIHMQEELMAFDLRPLLLGFLYKHLGRTMHAVPTIR